MKRIFCDVCGKEIFDIESANDCSEIFSKDSLKKFSITLTVNLFPLMGKHYHEVCKDCTDAIYEKVQKYRVCLQESIIILLNAKANQ